VEDSGRYRVLRKLATGGMAEVYEARAHGSRGFSRRVALKRVRADRAGDASFERMFFDEARIAGHLRHPGIVAVLDYGVEGDAPFQVLELVDGPDLAAVIRERGSLPEALALHVGAEVAFALDHAHRATDEAGRPLGIVHRDVSPSNVLLDREGHVKLSDFGIAFAHERSETTTDDTVKGKLLFMPPEQATRGHVDARADVFALACVVHAALTGRSPLSGPDAFVRILGGSPLQLDEVLTDDVRAVLAKALLPRRSDRHADAAELGEELARLARARLEEDPRVALRRLLSPMRQAQPEDPFGALFELSLVDAKSRRYGRTELGTEALPVASEPPVTTQVPDPEAPREEPAGHSELVAEDASSTAEAAPAATRVRWPLALVLVLALASGAALAATLTGAGENQTELPAAPATDGAEATGVEATAVPTSSGVEATAVPTSSVETSGEASGVGTSREAPGVEPSERALEDARERGSGGASEAADMRSGSEREPRSGDARVDSSGADPPAPEAGSRRTRSPASRLGERGTLVVGGAAALRAAILVDGRPRGHAPATLELDVGHHAVVLVTPAGERLRREVDLRAEHTPRAPLRWVVP